MTLFKTLPMGIVSLALLLPNAGCSGSNSLATSDLTQALSEQSATLYASIQTVVKSDAQFLPRVKATEKVPFAQIFHTSGSTELNKAVAANVKFLNQTFGSVGAVIEGTNGAWQKITPAEVLTYVRATKVTQDNLGIFASYSDSQRIVAFAQSLKVMLTLKQLRAKQKSGLSLEDPTKVFDGRKNQYDPGDGEGNITFVLARNFDYGTLDGAWEYGRQGNAYSTWGEAMQACLAFKKQRYGRDADVQKGTCENGDWMKKPFPGYDGVSQ